MPKIKTLGISSKFFVDSMDDKILTYSINANGVMSPVSGIAPKATGVGPGQLLVW